MKATKALSYDEAIEAYTKAINLNPDYVEAYTNRGMSYRIKGDTEKAKRDPAVSEMA